MEEILSSVSRGLATHVLQTLKQSLNAFIYLCQANVVWFQYLCHILYSNESQNELQLFSGIICVKEIAWKFFGDKLIYYQKNTKIQWATTQIELKKKNSLHEMTWCTYLPWNNRKNYYQKTLELITHKWFEFLCFWDYLHY